MGVESVESRPSILDHEGAPPFGYDDWIRSKRGLLPGGVIRTFRSPQGTWDRVMVRQSLMLVRDGGPIEEVVTTQN